MKTAPTMEEAKTLAEMLNAVIHDKTCRYLKLHVGEADPPPVQESDHDRKEKEALEWFILLRDRAADCVRRAEDRTRDVREADATIRHLQTDIGRLEFNLENMQGRHEREVRALRTHFGNTQEFLALNMNMNQETVARFQGQLHTKDERIAAQRREIDELRLAVDREKAKAAEARKRAPDEEHAHQEATRTAQAERDAARKEWDELQRNLETANRQILWYKGQLAQQLSPAKRSRLASGSSEPELANKRPKVAPARSIRLTPQQLNSTLNGRSKFAPIARLPAQPLLRPSPTQTPARPVPRPSSQRGAMPLPRPAGVVTPIAAPNPFVLPDQDLRALTPQQQQQREQIARTFREQQRASFARPEEAPARGPSIDQVGANSRLGRPPPIAAPVTHSLANMGPSGPNSGPFLGLFSKGQLANPYLAQMQCLNLPTPAVQTPQAPRTTQSTDPNPSPSNPPSTTSRRCTPSLAQPLSKFAQSVVPPQRRSICLNCREELWDDTCDAGATCKNCHFEGKSCVHVRCKKDCSRSNCWRAHSTDAFPKVQDKKNIHRRSTKEDKHLSPSPVEKERVNAQKSQQIEQDLRKEVLKMAQDQVEKDARDFAIAGRKSGSRGGVQMGSQAATLQRMIQQVHRYAPLNGPQPSHQQTAFLPNVVVSSIAGHHGSNPLGVQVGSNCVASSPKFQYLQPQQQHQHSPPHQQPQYQQQNLGSFAVPAAYLSNQAGRYNGYGSPFQQAMQGGVQQGYENGCMPGTPHSSQPRSQHEIPHGAQTSAPLAPNSQQSLAPMYGHQIGSQQGYNSAVPNSLHRSFPQDIANSQKFQIYQMDGTKFGPATNFHETFGNDLSGFDVNSFDYGVDPFQYGIGQPGMQNAYAGATTNKLHGTAQNTLPTAHGETIDLTQDNGNNVVDDFINYDGAPDPVQAGFNNEPCGGASRVGDANNANPSSTLDHEVSAPEIVQSGTQERGFKGSGARYAG